MKALLQALGVLWRVIKLRAVALGARAAAFRLAVAERLAAFNAWILEHPIVSGLGGYEVAGWLSEKHAEMELWFDETIAEQRQAVFDFWDDAKVDASDFVQHSMDYWTEGINTTLGTKGTALEIKNLDGAHVVSKIKQQILKDVNEGGGVLLNGQEIQAIRTGAIPTRGYAASGVAATDEVVAARQEAIRQQTAAAYAALTEEEKQRRIDNCARQAKYRKTHVRKTHWIERPPGWDG